MQLHQPLALLHIAFAPRQILRLPRVHQVDFQTHLLEEVVHWDPVHARGLHGYGPNSALLQPIGHGSQLGCRAPEVPHRLAVVVRRDRHVVGFVADVNAGGVGMDEL